MWIISGITRRLKSIIENRKYKNLAKGCKVPVNITISNRDNLVMMEGADIEPGALILNINAKFIIGKYSGVGPNVTVITGNHMSVVGKYLMQVTDDDKRELDPDGLQDQDVILEEDVWLGANVVLLNGVRIGRGAVVAASSVCRTKIPPYSIVAGNPAKVVGFRFTPDEIEEHEMKLYPSDARLSRTILDKNYKKYYLDRLKEINQFCRI